MRTPVSIQQKLPKLRIVAFNDVYELTNLPRLQTFVGRVKPDAVILSGDFLSPSTLSAVDGGKGMITTLRAVGVTHCCLGNHEADWKLPRLYKRLQKLGQTVTIVNSNIARGPLPAEDEMMNRQSPEWLRQPSDWMPEYSFLSTPCQQVKIAIVGLLSDEASMFRDGTFRGAPIANVTQTYNSLHERLVQTGRADWMLPLTHQSMQRDEELARHMLLVSGGNGLILGGHEHIPCNKVVSLSNETDSSTVKNDHANNCHSDDRTVQILKAGCEAKAVHLVDLTFDPSTEEILVDRKADLIELTDFPPSVVVSGIVQERMAVLESLDTEDIVHAHFLLPPGVSLTSKGSRYRQTTVGNIFCTAVKDELEVDVAIINGATIKGETEYNSSSMSYAALKKELPFPTKMVVVPMKRWELHDAIYYSRTRNPDVLPEELNDPNNASSIKVERKGYLQVDTEFDRIGFHTGDQDDDLMVALPRNLMSGFCNIEPLMQIGDRLKAQGTFPADDDHIRAIDLIVRHFCKERWFEMVSELHFTDLDTTSKGFLTRADVKRILAQTIGHEPAPFLVDDMIAAMDVDENGIIDAGEFSYLLATMERERCLVPIRFE
jgi:2',3'-cyclic-nucleotide 2'-phosphodiesterase (5'-nucleotidase family)